jgi:hypothetical protein
MSNPLPHDRTLVLIQLSSEQFARSEVLCAQSAELLLLARAHLAQAQALTQRSDTPPAGFDTAGNVSGLSKATLWRLLSA